MVYFIPYIKTVTVSKFPPLSKERKVWEFLGYW
jgi:hypothetical protein